MPPDNEHIGHRLTRAYLGVSNPRDRIHHAHTNRIVQLRSAHIDRNRGAYQSIDLSLSCLPAAHR